MGYSLLAGSVNTNTGVDSSTTRLRRVLFSKVDNPPIADQNLTNQQVKYFTKQFFISIIALFESF